jgi:hypothetical protein
MKPKPTITLPEGENVIDLVVAARKAMHKNGFKKLSDEMVQKAFNSDTYEEALQVIHNYVEVENG